MHVLAIASHPMVGKLVSILANEGGVNSGPGGWMTELRGILTVIIGIVAFMGSIYLILGTNLGARLGFLVALAGLAGWMFLMGAIWWSYGIGLKGPDPSWAKMPGKTVLQDVSSLNKSGALKGELGLSPDATPAQVSDAVKKQFEAEGWNALASSNPAYGQTSSAADNYLKLSGAFADNTAYKVVSVYNIGGKRYPTFFKEKVDYIAFWHDPRYVVVEVAPVIQQRTEPGRAPAVPRIDETRPHQYVYMVRDLGARREPAGFITVGSFIVFVMLCWLLHRRDKRVWANRKQLALPAKA